MEFVRLPVNVWPLIGSYLDYEDILSLNCVSHSVRNRVCTGLSAGLRVHADSAPSASASLVERLPRLAFLEVHGAGVMGREEEDDLLLRTQNFACLCALSPHAGLKSVTMKRLGAALSAKNPPLRALRLSGEFNSMSSDVPVLRSLCTGPCLVYDLLGCMNRDAEGMREAMAELWQPQLPSSDTLRELSLTRLQLNSLDLINIVCDGMRHLRSLRRLRLRYNGLGPLAATQILDALHESGAPLVALDLTANRLALSTGVVGALFPAIARFDRLTSLRLDGNGLKSQHVEELVAGTLCYLQLTHLSLSDNDVQWLGFAALSELARLSPRREERTRRRRSRSGAAEGDQQSGAPLSDSLIDHFCNRQARDPPVLHHVDRRLRREGIIGSPAERALDDAVQDFWPSSPPDPGFALTPPEDHMEDEEGGAGGGGDGPIVGAECFSKLEVLDVSNNWIPFGSLDTEEKRDCMRHWMRLPALAYLLARDSFVDPEGHQWLRDEIERSGSRMHFLS